MWIYFSSRIPKKKTKFFNIFDAFDILLYKLKVKNRHIQQNKAIIFSE